MFVYLVFHPTLPFRWCNMVFNICSIIHCSDMHILFKDNLLPFLLSCFLFYCFSVWIILLNSSQPSNRRSFSTGGNSGLWSSIISLLAEVLIMSSSNCFHFWLMITAGCSHLTWLNPAALSQILMWVQLSVGKKEKKPFRQRLIMNQPIYSQRSSHLVPTWALAKLLHAVNNAVMGDLCFYSEWAICICHRTET